MPGTRAPFGDIPVDGVLAELQGLRGGKRLQQTIAKFAQILANRDGMENTPKLFSASQAASLSAPAVVECPGENLLLQAQNAEQQTVAELVVFGTVASGNYTTVYARMPGALGNGIRLVIATPGTAAAVDSLQDTSTPTVTWTPETGDVDTSISTLNSTSKLVWAVKTGTGGTLASQSSTALAGGIGAGVRVYVGAALVADNTEYGARFDGSADGTYVQYWDNDFVTISIDDADLAVGKAVPTGRTALTAVVSHIVLRLEWIQPKFQTSISIGVKA